MSTLSKEAISYNGVGVADALAALGGFSEADLNNPAIAKGLMRVLREVSYMRQPQGQLATKVGDAAAMAVIDAGGPVEE